MPSENPTLSVLWGGLPNPVVGCNWVVVRESLPRHSERRCGVTGQGYDEGYLQKTRTVECAPGFVPFTRASSAGLTGKRAAGCLRREAPSFTAPRQTEQRSVPEGPRSRVPRGIQGSANPFHMPSGAQAGPQSRRGFDGMSGPVEKSQRRVRTGLNAP